MRKISTKIKKDVVWTHTCPRCRTVHKNNARTTRYCKKCRDEMRAEKLAGKPRPKFQIGDRVGIKGLKATGRIGHAQYRVDEKGWFYKVETTTGGYQSWSESDLKKLRGKSL